MSPQFQKVIGSLPGNVTVIVIIKKPILLELSDVLWFIGIVILKTYYADKTDIHAVIYVALKVKV